MKKSKSSPKIVVVVEVMAGVAVNAYGFSTLKDARACLKKVRDQRNPNNDDVQIFSCVVDEYDM